MADIPSDTSLPGEATSPRPIGNELTNVGRASMQGDSVSPPGQSSVRGLSSPELSPKDVRQIIPIAEIPEQIPQLSCPAANDLELAAQHANATKATRWHAEQEQGNAPEYYRLRSEITEEIAKSNIENSIRSDPYSVVGTNFPNYDVFSRNEMCSVKLHAFEKHTAGKKISKEYTDEFADLINSESKPNRKAAERMQYLRTNDAGALAQLSSHLPPQVSAAENPAAMQAAMAESAYFRVPQDQVEGVRAELLNQIVQDPRKFGLAVGTQPDEIKQLLNKRVLTIDERYATAHYQAKAANMFVERETELKTLDA